MLKEKNQIGKHHTLLNFNFVFERSIFWREKVKNSIVKNNVSDSDKNVNNYKQRKLGSIGKKRKKR